MNERDWNELNGAISDGSFEKANLRTLLRYDRAIKGRPSHEVSPVLRDQIRRMISQKVTMMAVGTMIMASLLGATIVWVPSPVERGIINTGIAGFATEQKNSRALE